MDDELKDRLAKLLGAPIRSCSVLSGGDISQSWLLETPACRLFCKLHSGQDALPMFQAEENGLQAISSTGTVKTPEVLVCQSLGTLAALILEYIEPKSPSDSEMQAFGQQLAALHAIEQYDFGWEKDNFIGSLPQSNSRAADWCSFYVSERLLPQFNRAHENGLLGSNEIPGESVMETVFRKFCGPVRPSLLHGDLWGGNYLISQKGQAYLIDPAVYRGHYEVDLAMSRLFGGFSPLFYKGYESVTPFTAGYDERQDLYQLYYLLVHLNLFGRSYYLSVKQLLNRYFTS
jgi:fructosamine-3-kinase